MKAQPLPEERATPLTCSPLLGGWSKHSQDHSALQQEKGTRSQGDGPVGSSRNHGPQAERAAGDGAAPGRLGEEPGRRAGPSEGAGRALREPRGWSGRTWAASGPQRKVLPQSAWARLEPQGLGQDPAPHREPKCFRGGRGTKGWAGPDQGVWGIPRSQSL